MDFGYRELNMAAKLLGAFKGPSDQSTLDVGVAVEFNPNSGNVFLVDEDYNVAMMNGDKLEDWINCPECGHEDFDSEFLDSSVNDCCKEYSSERVS